MGRSIQAKLFYGVCLESNEYELDEDGDETDERKPGLEDALKEKYPDFDGYGDEIPGQSELLETDITGTDDDLRTYLVLKPSSQERNPWDRDLALSPETLATADDQPFREFFELVGLPFVQPQWFLSCLYF